MSPAQPQPNPESSEWMFKLGDLLLGPVSGKSLLEKLYAGEVTRETPVAPPGGAFKRLGEIELFRVHLAKAEAKLRVDEESRAVTMARSRRFKTRTVLVAMATLAGVALAIWGARWLAVNKPWKKASDLAMPEITVDLPTITVASASRYASDEVLLPSISPTKIAQPKNPAAGATKTGTAKAGKGGETALAMAGKPPANEDDLTRPQYDSSAINEVVNGNKKSLFPCLVEEVRRRPGFAAKIPIEFAVGNDGHVAKLWIDHPEFKNENNELHRCMLERLQKWKFPTYQGERATVALSFNIGAR